MKIDYKTLLVEGPTEEIIIRGILQKLNPSKDIFIVNCGSVTNIPFYQKVYRKFAIKTHIICDTDEQISEGLDEFFNPIFLAGIQSAIYREHNVNCKNVPKLGGLLRTNSTTFEVAHKEPSIDERLRFSDHFIDSHGKPFNANRYWVEILEPNFESEQINEVPIVSFLKEIIDFEWT